MYITKKADLSEKKTRYDSLGLYNRYYGRHKSGNGVFRSSGTEDYTCIDSLHRYRSIHDIARQEKQ